MSSGGSSRSSSDDEDGSIEELDLGADEDDANPPRGSGGRLRRQHADTTMATSAVGTPRVYHIIRKDIPPVPPKTPSRNDSNSFRSTSAKSNGTFIKKSRVKKKHVYFDV